MSRIAIILTIIIAIPLLALGGVLFLLSNPEYYTPQLKATFKSEVGLELDIKGDIGWRYWPPIALRISDVQVRPPGAETPLASIKSASIDMQLLPLLQGSDNISIDGITLDGLTVNAIVDKDGHANWESPAAPKPTETGQPASGESGAGASSELGLDISSIKITNTRINYQDHQAGADYAISMPSLTTGSVFYGKPTNVATNLTIDDKTGGMHIGMDANGDITFDKGFKHFSFSHLDTHQKITMPGLKPLDITLRTNGKFSVPDSSVSADLDGTVNKTTVKGKLGAQFADRLNATFDLALNQVNPADFLPETDASKKKAADDTTPPQDVDVLPLELMKSMDVSGKLAIGALHYEDFTFNDLVANIALNNGDLKANAGLKGYDGNFNLDFTASSKGNGTGETKARIEGLDITKLTGYEWITGKVTLDSDTTFSGHMLSSIMDSLDGTTQFNIANGTMDVTPVKQVAAVVDSLRNKDSGITSWPDKMPFDHLKGEHKFVKGTSKNQQFNFTVQTLQLNGTGGFDYFKDHLGYDLALTFKNIDGSQFNVGPALEGIEWPLHCEGKMTDSPVDMCKPDKDGIQKLVTNVLKHEVKRRAEDTIKEKAKSLLKGLFGN